jgi:succinate dehydrogenase / fumarate reductase, flavoprotein subunit
LSFEHCTEAQLRAAGGPVIDRLKKNGIDLTKQAVEVAPMAHYHMGGVRADTSMATRVPGLFVAGEAVGGANGANRLSGNAITEALVFGRRAGQSAAAKAKSLPPENSPAFETARRRLEEGNMPRQGNPAALIEELQALMQKEVGPFRTGAGLERALARIESMLDALPAMKPPAGTPYDTELADWIDLSTMLRVAKCVAGSALTRTESRGAHQREDFPGMDAAWEKNQVIA